MAKKRDYLDELKAFVPDFHERTRYTMEGLTAMWKDADGKYVRTPLRDINRDLEVAERIDEFDETLRQLLDDGNIQYRKSQDEDIRVFHPGADGALQSSSEETYRSDHCADLLQPPKKPNGFKMFFYKWFGGFKDDVKAYERHQRRVEALDSEYGPAAQEKQTREKKAWEKLRVASKWVPMKDRAIDPAKMEEKVALQEKNLGIRSDLEYDKDDWTKESVYEKFTGEALYAAEIAEDADNDKAEKAIEDACKKVMENVERDAAVEMVRNNELVDFVIHGIMAEPEPLKDANLPYDAYNRVMVCLHDLCIDPPERLKRLMPEIAKAEEDEKQARQAVWTPLEERNIDAETKEDQTSRQDGIEYLAKIKLAIQAKPEPLIANSKHELCGQIALGLQKIMCDKMPRDTFGAVDVSRSNAFQEISKLALPDLKKMVANNEIIDFFAHNVVSKPDALDNINMTPAQSKQVLMNLNDYCIDPAPMLKLLVNRFTAEKTQPSKKAEEKTQPVKAEKASAKDKGMGGK